MERGHTIRFDENIFGFDVAMSHGRFPFSTDYFHVKMRQTIYDVEHHGNQFLDRQYFLL